MSGEEDKKEATVVQMKNVFINLPINFISQNGISRKMFSHRFVVFCVSVGKNAPFVSTQSTTMPNDVPFMSVLKWKLILIS